MLKKLLILVAVLSLTACHCHANKPVASTVSVRSITVESQASEDIEDYRRVYFGLDSSKLDESSKKMLKHQIKWLKENPEITAIIEGHCDERGSREYNIVLGEKRAVEVKNYLVKKGIDANRLKVVSYGKERPAVTGFGEDVWAKNRRSVTIIQE
jgi:peptidoglycan-associated lipoprotein